MLGTQRNCCFTLFSAFMFMFDKLSKFSCFLENTIYPIRKTSQQPNFQDEENLLLKTLTLIKKSPRFMFVLRLIN